MYVLLAWVLVLVFGVAQPEKPSEAPAASDPQPRAVPGESSPREVLRGLRARKGSENERRMEWTIDGVKRTAIVVFPAEQKGAAPVIFGFHGHGGTAAYAAAKFGYQRYWPEAICVYMEGLPTPGITDPKGEKRGWQKRLGDQGDRDLKFFDAVLETIRKDRKVDDARIFAAGHSNGGAFTYLLWEQRPQIFAAFAPAGAWIRAEKGLKPKPAMHIAGKNDPLVPFAGQNRMMEQIRTYNGCTEKSRTWAKDCEIYDSPSGTPLVAMVLDGGHEFPKEAPELIVRFFKEYGKPAVKPEAPAKKE